VRVVAEAEAILLSEEISADLILSDDASARAAAQQRGLDVMGTVGVLIEARERGLIAAAVPLLMELRRLGQWLGDDLIEAVRLGDRGSPT
jgi:uncharacterized protein